MGLLGIILGLEIGMVSRPHELKTVNPEVCLMIKCVALDWGQTSQLLLPRRYTKGIGHERQGRGEPERTYSNEHIERQ